MGMVWSFWRTERFSAFAVTLFPFVFVFIFFVVVAPFVFPFDFPIRVPFVFPIVLPFVVLFVFVFLFVKSGSRGSFLYVHTCCEQFSHKKDTKVSDKHQLRTGQKSTAIVTLWHSRCLVVQN